MLCAVLILAHQLFKCIDLSCFVVGTYHVAFLFVLGCTVPSAQFCCTSGRCIGFSFKLCPLPRAHCFSGYVAFSGYLLFPVR